MQPCLIGITLCLAMLSAAIGDDRAVAKRSEPLAVRGEHENPNQAFGKDANYQLDGDTTFGWKTGTLPGDI